MIRSVLLSACAVALLSAPAVAQTAKEAECRKQGQFATNIVADRKNGASQRQAERRALSSLSAEDKNYEPALVALTQWVYALPDENLPEVSALVYRTCLSQ